MPQSASIKNNGVLVSLLLIVLIACLSYSNTFFVPFVFDDNVFITPHGLSKEYQTIPAIWQSHSSRFIPFFTFFLNFRLHGFHPVGYHIVNLTIHILTSFLVFWLVRVFTKKQNVFLSLFTALLLAAHPIQTQAVTYIYQRQAAMAAFFVLLSLCLYCVSREKSGRMFFILLFGSYVSALCAFVSKENSFILPVVILLTTVFFYPAKHQKIRAVISAVWPYFLLPLIIFPLIFHSPSLFMYQQQFMRSNHEYPQYKDITHQSYLLTQMNVVRTYVRLLFLPFDQNIDYDYPVTKYPDIATVLSFLLHGGLLFLALRLRNRQRLLSFGIFFFYLTLGIESSIIPLGDVIFEHRMYLPMFGASLAISSCFLWLSTLMPSGKNRKTIQYGALIAVTIVLAILTYKRNIVWGTRISIWEDTVAKSPLKARPHFNLAVVYDADKQHEKALLHYERSTALEPNNPEALVNMGLLHAINGNPSKAQQLYEKADSIDPNSDALLNLGVLFMKYEKFEDAYAVFQKLLERNPKNVYALYNMGLVYESLGNTEEGERYYQAAKDQAAGIPEYMRVIEQREKDRQDWYKTQEKK